MKDKPNHGGVRKGAGRPPRKTPLHTITLKIEEDIAQKFRNLCAARERSQSKQFAEMVKRSKIPTK